MAQGYVGEFRLRHSLKEKGGWNHEDASRQFAKGEHTTPKDN